ETSAPRPRDDATDSRRVVGEAFEAFLEEFAVAFARVPGAAVDAEIDHWMRRIVEFFDADRSSLAELVASGELVITHSYARPGYEILTGARVAVVPWLLELWQKGEAFHFSDISEVPAEGHDLIHRLGLQSHMSVPVRIADQLIGAFMIGD